MHGLRFLIIVYKNIMPFMEKKNIYYYHQKYLTIRRLLFELDEMRSFFIWIAVKAFCFQLIDKFCFFSVSLITCSYKKKASQINLGF